MAAVTRSGLLLITCVFLVASSVYSIASQADGCDQDWSNFVEKYNKSYTSKLDYELRRKIFCKNLEFVTQRNILSGRDDFGINSKSDWTSEELAKLVMKPEALKKSINRIGATIHVDKLFKKYDLNSVGAPFVPNTIFWNENPKVVGPVKHQGACGSCWVFAAVGLIEANEHKWDDQMTQVVPLSEQQIIDCGFGKDRDTCDGGFTDEVLRYVKQTGGLMKDEDYPYLSGETEVKHKCRLNETEIHAPTRRMNYFAKLEGADEQVLKRVVAQYGPISIAIYATSEFHNIREHVYKSTECHEGQEPNHEVLLVGYGTTEWGEDYWLIKNSWGKDWGVGGYGRLARNQNDSCSITSSPVILI